MRDLLVLFLISLLGSTACNRRLAHGRIRFNLDVQISDTAGRPVPGASMKLLDTLDGVKGFPSLPPVICRSDTDGRCMATFDYFFTIDRFDWPGRTYTPKENRFMLYVDAAGFEREVSTVPRLSERQVAGDVIRLKIPLDRVK